MVRGRRTLKSSLRKEATATWAGSPALDAAPKKKNPGCMTVAKVGEAGKGGTARMHLLPSNSTERACQAFPNPSRADGVSAAPWSQPYSTENRFFSNTCAKKVWQISLSISDSLPAERTLPNSRSEGWGTDNIIHKRRVLPFICMQLAAAYINSQIML